MATFETKHTHASPADLLRIRIESLDGNESYEKETKHIHASADLLHIRIGNLDWHKCGRCSSMQFLWVTAGLLVTRVSFIYLVDEFFFLFLV